MTDRPLAICRDGKLYLDNGFPDYYPASRFSVVMRREIMLSLSGPDAARKAAECQAALTEYEKQRETVNEK